MKLNYRDPAWALLLISSLFFAMYQCESAKNDKLEVRRSWAELHGKEREMVVAIKSADSIMLVVEARRQKDKEKFENHISYLKASVGHWKKKALYVRPAVVQLSDSIPVLKEFIEANDSIIAKQDSIIDVQAGHILVQGKLFQFEIAQAGEKYVKQTEISELWRQQAVSSEKKLARSERRKHFWRGCAVVVGAVAVGLVAASQ